MRSEDNRHARPPERTPQESPAAADGARVWRHALAAGASVLLVGAAVPAGAVPAAVSAMQAPDEVRAVAMAARAVASADERLHVALVAAADEAAARTVQQRRAADAARAAAEAEAQRVAAENAAAQAAEAAAVQAAAAKAAAKATKPAPRRPATSSAAPPPPAAPEVRWSTRVVNSGGQDAVNACAGGLTRWFENVDGKPYYPIHRGCGGTPILGLRLGDRVRIDGALWTVTDSRDVPQGAHYSAAAGLAGQVLLQTCYRDDLTMRIVALTPA